MSEDWPNVEHGLFESSDGQWHRENPRPWAIHLPRAIAQSGQSDR